MHAFKKWSLATVAAAVVTLGTPAAFAGTSVSTMTMDPTSGPPGTAVQVSSVTECPYTDGAYDVTARVGDQPDLMDGPVLGAQEVGDGGPWSIPITIPEDAVGGSTVTVYAQCIGNPSSQNEADGGVAAGPGDVVLSTYTPLTFTVTAPPTTTTTSTTTSTSTSTSTTAVVTTTTTTPPSMTAVPEFMYPGESCLITAHGFTPGTGVTITIYSDPRVIGTFAADANGSISQSWQVPSGFAAGAHTVVLTGQSIAGSIEMSAPITVGSLVQNATTVAPTTAAPVATITTTGSLPTTGSGLTQPLVFGAAMLVLGGGAAVVVSRRRSHAER